MKTKQSPFEINFANDVQFDIFKNINFEYNSVLYDNRISSQLEYNVLVNALVQSVNGTVVNSDEVLAVTFVANDDYSYGEYLEHYTVAKITTYTSYRDYDIYVLVVTKD